MFLLASPEYMACRLMVRDAVQEYARKEALRTVCPLFLLCFLQKIRKGQKKYFLDGEEGKTGK